MHCDPCEKPPHSVVQSYAKIFLTWAYLLALYVYFPWMQPSFLLSVTVPYRKPDRSEKVLAEADSCNVATPTGAVVDIAKTGPYNFYVSLRTDFIHEFIYSMPCSIRFRSATIPLSFPLCDSAWLVLLGLD